MKKSDLLDRSKYHEESKKYDNQICTFEIIKNNQVLFYFGATHTYNPRHEQFIHIKKYWNNFLEKSKNTDRIILIEGGVRKIERNETEAIIKDGEAGFLTYLGNQSEVKVISPKIDNNLVPQELFEGNDKDELLLYCKLCYLDQYNRIEKPNLSFDEYFDNWFIDEVKSGIWNYSDLDNKRLDDLYKILTGTVIKYNESQKKYLNPNILDTKLNLIAKEISDIRDYKIACEIEKQWIKGKSIFVIYGFGHLIIQKPALEKWLK